MKTVYKYAIPEASAGTRSTKPFLLPTVSRQGTEKRTVEDVYWR